MSIYQTFMSYSEIGGDMMEKIKRHGLYDVFEPLYTNLPEDQYLWEEIGKDALFNKIIFYIIRVYSVESEENIVGIDWKGIKHRIFYSLFPYEESVVSDLFDEVVYLKNVGVRRTVAKYIDMQQSEVYNHYVKLSDLYHEMLDAAVSPLKKNEEIDYATKYACSEYAQKLYKQKEEWEQKIKTEFSTLDEGKKEIIAPKAIHRTTMSIEDHVT